VKPSKRDAAPWLRLVCLCAGPLFAQPKPVALVTEEWAPYNYTGVGKLEGYSVEIVQALEKELHLDCPIRMLPGMRAKLVLESQPRTMMITMLRTPERETLYKWIGPLGDGAIYFYKRKGNPLVVTSLEEARKAPLVACRNGGLVRNRLREDGFSNLDTTATDGPSIYRKLLLGRCDLAVSDAPLGVRHLLREWKLPPDTLVQTSVKIVESPLYIACSRDIPDTEIAAWQAALENLRTAGTLDALWRKYAK